MELIEVVLNLDFFSSPQVHSYVLCGCGCECMPKRWQNLLKLWKGIATLVCAGVSSSSLRYITQLHIIMFDEQFGIARLV